VPDTGQTTKYSTAFGDDSDYLINPPSYTDNGDGTITDNVTGLMWQKCTNAQTGTNCASGGSAVLSSWSQATNVCGSLTTGGHNDWRLPDEFELMTIANYGTASPTIYAGTFHSTVSSMYWSATTFAGNTSGAWVVYFSNGFVNYFINKLNPAYVRCVRGNPTTPSFTDNNDGTVTDNVTTLMWQKQDDGTTRTWESAITYCENLNLPSGGYSDWRLPNIKELKSIVDNTTSNPAIDTGKFPATVSSMYWSATTYHFNTSSAWPVDFYDGLVGSRDKSLSTYVRCVR
jgi:hypothetical protein